MIGALNVRLFADGADLDGNDADEQIAGFTTARHPCGKSALASTRIVLRVGGMPG